MRAPNLPGSQDLKKSKAQLIEELELWRSGQMEAAPSHDSAPDFSSAQLAGLVRSADDAIISMDGAHGIRMFNDGAARIFGYSAEEVIGQSIDMLLPEEVRPRHRKHVNDFAKGGERSRLMGQHSEVFGLRKNGEKFPAEASISKIEVESKLFFTVILRDITEGKRAEVELQENRRVLRDALENLADGVSMVDADLNIVAYNRKYLDMLELPAELHGQDPKFEDIIRYNAERGEYGPGDVAEQVRSRVEQASRFEPHQFERTRPDGTVIEIRGDPLPGGGFITTYKDITERKRTEEALRESERRFSDILNYIPSSMNVKDLDGRYAGVNRVYAEQRGLPEEEIIGKTAYDLFPKDTADQGTAQEREVIQTGGTVGQERTHLFQDGSLHTILSTKFPVADKEGRIIGVGTIGTDITQRKQAEEALRESEARFRSMMDHSGSSMFLKDLEGRYTLVNRVFAERRGLPAEEIIGQTAEELYPREFAERITNQDRIVLQTGRGVEWEHQATRSDGTERIVMNSKFPVLDGEGRITGVGTIATDITERKQAEEALRESEERFRSVMDHSPASMFLKDLEGRYTLVNRVFAERLGRPEGEITGKFAEDLYPKDFAEGVSAQDRKVLQTGSVVEWEHEITLPDGTERTVMNAKFPVLDGEGRITGVGTIATDITERKQAEKTLLMAQTTIDKSADSIFWVNADAVIEYANDSACRRLGYSREELLAMTVHDIDPGLPRDRWKEHWNALKHAGSKSLESVHRTRDGQLIPVEVSITQLQFGDREYHCAIVRDITERKQAEEALRESEQRFRGLMDHSPSSMSLKDLEGRYTLVNRVFAERRGCTENDMIGKTVFDFNSKEFAEFIADHEKEVLATGGFVEREHESTFDDGSQHIVLTAKFPVRDNEAHIIGVGTIVTDISERKQAEEALREGEERFRSVIDHSPSVIHLKDLEGRYTMVNRTFAERRGCSVEEIIGKTPSDFYSEDFAGDIAEHDQKVVETGNIDEWEHENNFRDGYKRIIVSTKFPVFDQENRIIGVGTITNDTTERKQAEEALRENEERFRSVMDHSPSAIFLKDLEGRYILVNRILAGHSGYTEAEMIGKTADEVFPAGFAQRVKDQDAEVLEKGIVIDQEHNLPPRDGTERVVLTTKFPVMNSERRIVAVGTISTDVTERKQADQDLRASQRLLTAVINTIDHWVYAKDVDSRYLLVNNAMASDLELNPEDMIGQATAAFRSKIDQRYGSDEELAALVEMDRKVIETGESQYVANFVLTSPDGGRRMHRISKMPLTDESGAAVGVVGMSENITQQMILEQQLRESQKMEAVGQLAGGIAHEFNNMLQVVINSAQFLKIQLGDSRKEQNMVDIILRASDRSANLTRQLLAFSRKSVIQPVIMRLDQLISNDMIMLGRVIGENFQIEYQSIDGLWPIKADPGMMGQIILNLCINARDAMPNGGRILVESENFTATSDFAEAHGLEGAGEYVMLAVSDNGNGMTPEIRERIFEPFFTTKEVGQGTGLGLAMVQGAVQQHHGAIEVSSEEGKGSAFTIYFPRAETAEEGPAATTQQDAAGGNETILVAEDEFYVLSVLSQALESRGYRVLTAVDGQDALAVYKANAGAINLVILDMVMPFMNGREVFTKLREEGFEVPILFSSGYSPGADDFAFLNDNGIPLIQKPYALHDLYSAVRQALDDEGQAAASS